MIYINTLYTKNFYESIYSTQQIKELIKNKKITDFYNITKFKNINQEIIDKYKNKPWDWEWLIQNTNIYVEKYISFHLIKKYSYKWDYFKLSKNQNLTEEFILKYPNQNWDIKYLIKKNKITNFNALTKFKKIDEYTIYSYSDKPWDWEWLIENTKLNRLCYIPYNLIKKYPYNWDFSSNYRHLTEKFILKYPYQNWNINYLIIINKITDFKALSKFKKINQYIISKYPNKPWDWGWLIENTNIDVEKHIPSNIIEKYSYKWNYNKLKKNKNFIRKTQEKIFYKIKN